MFGMCLAWPPVFGLSVPTPGPVAQVPSDGHVNILSHHILPVYLQSIIYNGRLVASVSLKNSICLLFFIKHEATELVVHGEHLE